MPNRPADPLRGGSLCIRLLDVGGSQRQVGRERRRRGLLPARNETVPVRERPRLEEREGSVSRGRGRAPTSDRRD